MEEKDSERMAELVNLAKQKDVNAFSLLYEMIYMDLYRMARYTLNNTQDAEDIVSDTVLTAYMEISKLRDASAFRSWIFCILTRKCKQKIKEYVKERDTISTDNELFLRTADPSADIGNLVDKSDIAKAFQSLTAEERLIVTMSIYGGYNSREIASILHKNHNTIRSKYRRALKKMQTCLI